MKRKLRYPLIQALPTPAMMEADRREYDFDQLEPHEKPMAIAWEYSREVHDKIIHPREIVLFNEKTGKKKTIETKGAYQIPKSDYLNEVLLTFTRSLCWPKKPFLALTYSQRRHAFPHCFWPKPSDEQAKEWQVSPLNKSLQKILFRKKNHNQRAFTAALRSIVTPAVIDTTPGIKESHAGWQEMIMNVSPNETLPLRHRLYLVDLEKGTDAIIKDLTKLVNKAVSVPVQGRSEFERDLKALNLLRIWRLNGENLNQIYNTEHDNNPNAIKSAYKGLNLPSKTKCYKYLTHAKIRLGLKLAKGIEPMFQWI